MEIAGFIKKQNWIFAKTYATRAPHEYIVRGKINGTDGEFLAMNHHIQENGIIMYFWGHPNRYVFQEDYYYWVMKNDDDDPSMIINRAKIEDYKISVVWKGPSEKAKTDE